MVKTHFVEDCRLHTDYKVSVIVNGIIIMGTIESIYDDIITLQDVALIADGEVRRFKNYNIDADKVAGWSIMEKVDTFDNLKQLR